MEVKRILDKRGRQEFGVVYYTFLIGSANALIECISCRSYSLKVDPSLPRRKILRLRGVRC